MHPLAREVLERLWRAGDGADMRASQRTPTVSLTHKQFPGYASLPSHADKERFHAELAEAQRLGAISIAWERRAGPGGQIQRLTLVSLPALAEFLGVRPTTAKVADAEAALAPWRNTWLAADQIINSWRAGRSPRGVAVDAWPKVVEAFRVMDHCREQNYADVSERRVSAQLFRDSKHIEALTTILDLLTAPAFDQSEARHAEATLAALGLLKHPSAFLVAGPVQIKTSLLGGGVERSSVLTPYSGYSPRHVVGAEGAPAYLLSVENLTIFHELANGLAGPLRGVLVYTGGYPSPSQLRGYVALLRSFPDDMPVWHWGDTDLGGFRIAGLLAEQVGRSLRLWNMATYDEGGVGPALGKGEVGRIAALCERWGWPEEQLAVARHAARIEQELQALKIPG
jgi:Uncharacterized protein conserved in bacteria C-term(DUF2220).